MADRLCQRWLITGRVQGIGYRAWLVMEGNARGLDGWVRNLADGRVEAVVSGEPDAIAYLHAACRHGPPGARVEGIEVLPAEPDSITLRAGFRQIRSGM
jgi:acylphosphatase